MVLLNSMKQKQVYNEINYNYLNPRRFKKIEAKNDTLLNYNQIWTYNDRMALLWKS